MESAERENNVYRLEKYRDKASKDVTHVKNREGIVLKCKRWREYSNELLNEENTRVLSKNSEPNQGIEIL